MVENCDKVWNKFLSKHWKMFALFIAGIVIACIGVLRVFLWFVEEAQLTDLVPESLGLWSMGHFISFLLNLIFWEAILIGIPVVIFVLIIYFVWWKQLPETERKEYKDGDLFGKNSKSKDAGGAITFVINVFFIIKIRLDGNWDKPFADWTFDYLVYSYLTALFWLLLICSIPLVLGGLWWITKNMKK